MESADSTSQNKTSGRDHLLLTALMFTVLVAVVAVLGKGLNLNPSSTGSALVGKKAADFRLPSIESGSTEVLSLSAHLGSPVVINFWASWCVSCREEARILEASWQKYKNSGLKVLGVAVQDTKEDALRFAKYFGKTYPLGLDEDGRTGIDYGVTGVPETFFIDRRGIIVHKIAGPITPLEWDRQVMSILQP